MSASILTRRNLSSTLTPTPQHIALLGATGGTGLALIKEHISTPDSPQKPYLTLYTRPSGHSKLSSILPQSVTSSTPAPKIRIIQGELNDPSAILTALSASTSTSISNSPDSNTSTIGTTTTSPPPFPQVTTVISLLGSYISLRYFLTRHTPTPLATALTTTIIPTMRSLKIRRILTLSTATGFRLPRESARMSWSWWLINLFPVFVVPQGNAEMREIGRAVLGNEGSNDEGGKAEGESGLGLGLRQREGLDATVVRVPPVLSGKGPELEVLAFEELGGVGSSESKEVSKRSLARWFLREAQVGEWIGRAPVVVNPVGK